MQIVVHERFPDEPSVGNQNFGDQWNALVQTMERPQVFFTYEWARAVMRAYTKSLRPLLVAAYREDQLVGVLALAHEAKRNRVWFLTGSTADYCDFVSSPADREEFILLAMRELRHFGVGGISFANLPADSISAQVLQRHARRTGYSIFSRPAYLCAQIPFDSEESRSQTRKSVRSKLKRRLNAGEDGDLVVRHAEGWQELESEFTEFTTAHVQRFLAAGHASNLVRSERRVFLMELGKLLSARGWIAFSTVKRGERTIAWNYGFRFCGSWFWYQPAFDTEMAHFSPGSYLLCEILRQASEDPQIHTVDLGLGNEEYKKRYSKSGRMTLHITASSIPTKALEVCRYRSATLVKRIPRLERGIRDCITKTNSLRRRIGTDGIANAMTSYTSRALKSLVGVSEVSFFECTQPQLSAGEFSLRPLSLRLLANAAMEYEDDTQMAEYVLRAAERLKSHSAEGFALTTPTGDLLHLCWTSRFDGFWLTELRQHLKEPAPYSVLLFDCWTPSKQRGNGYYALCIAAVATKILAEGKRPWIFSAAENATSLRGIEKAGFVARFSLTRRKKFFTQTISSVAAAENGGARVGLYPAA